MKDTPDAVSMRYRALLMARPGAERLRMGCDMFDTARALVRSAVATGDAPSARAAVFLRTYGADFDARTRECILLALDSASGRPRPT